MDPERTMDRRRAIELLDAVGLGGRSGHRPAEMAAANSGNCDCESSCQRSPLLLSPTNPGKLDDEEKKRIIMDLLCSSCRKLAQTLIPVSHDRQAVSAADAVFELRAGTLTGRRDGVENLPGLNPQSTPVDDERAGLVVELVTVFPHAMWRRHPPTDRPYRGPNAFRRLLANRGSMRYILEKPIS